jgi:micrococcal nuclease
MRRIAPGASLVLVLALGLGVAAWQAVEPEPALRIIDGDTLELNGETIRIENLDAPEMPGRAECQIEADLAVKAKGELERITKGKVITLRRNTQRPTDQYGRTLAVVLADGQDVATPLISAGLARPWRGRSSDWCV